MDVARRSVGKRQLAFASLGAGISLLAACSNTPAPEASYYSENIQPVFTTGCVQQTTGCHVAASNGAAAGNLDLSSYDALSRRSDVLPSYGPYPVGVLLLKAGDPVDIQVDTFDPPDPAHPEERFVRIRTDIRHNAGRTVSLSSSGYALLKRWIDSGHTRTSVPPPPPDLAQSACKEGVGSAPGFDPAAAPSDGPGFDRFLAEVQPVLGARCAGGNCHGSPIADFHLSCGRTEAEQRWNYFVSVEHLSTPAVQSEILRRPLAVLRGGTFHEGGDVFSSPDDPDYATIRAWAEDLVTRRPELVRADETDPGLRFFANRVQPVLVRKGCMFMNCHSPAMFHELRLRTGSQGTFSRVATRRNYDAAKLLLAIESPNANNARIIAKNLYPPDLVAGSDGIAHRGGSLFEDFGSGGALRHATPSDCAGVDADHGDLNEIPAYCVLVRWHAIEREAAVARGELLPATDSVRAVVWVSRPLGSGSITDFDTYRPGADLRIADATVAADGSLSLAASRSLLSGCGLDASTADVRTPAVSWNGEQLAFAARSAASSPLRLYRADADGSSCERVPDVAPSADVDAATGILLHDFDPAFAPDGRIVFASTRGTLDPEHPFAGPSRTPAAMAPNANLYIYEPSETTKVRQLTYLLNQELAPSFMADGRLIFTTEKREPDFHQLAGRRMNLDGGDYHPLFAQRPSVGFASATEIAELPNRNLVLVAGPIDAADGAGGIVVVNRSIGPDQTDRDPGDRTYIHAMRIPRPGALGGGMGAFRSPSPLPSGRILVSCDVTAASLTTGPFDFDLCELDPNTAAVRPLAGERGRAEVEAVAVYGRRALAPEQIFRSRIDEANGHTRVEPGARDAIVTVQDVPLLATLLYSNTRVGRPIDPRVGGLDVLVDHPPPASARSFADVAASTVTDAFGTMYLERTSLGHVPLEADGSTRFRYRGGMPIVLRLTDHDGTPLQLPEGAPFSGEAVQREQMQFYPGERANQALQRRFFNGLCGGCHGSITGRELDVAVNIDVLTSASRSLSYDREPTDLFQ